MKRTWFLIFFALLACIIFLRQLEHSLKHSKDSLIRALPAATQKFAYGPGRDQFGELWLPSGNGPHPVAILIHGGCWMEGSADASQLAYIAEDLRKSGIAVWNLEYRRLGIKDGGYPGTFHDIAQGIDYLRRISARHALDLSHVAVMGHSAGGHLALWAAGRGSLKKDGSLYRKNPLPVHVAVSLAGINDLAAYRVDGPACGGPKTIDAVSGGEGRYAETSPAAMLPLHVPQIIVSGGRDDVVPQRFGGAYGAAAKTAGDKVEIINIAGAGHMDFIDPDSGAWKQVRAALLVYLK
ncbi:MAG: alpha/beta hydrolase [Alphaproteobacteria bacterium]|nr:MAG: alpha/beta hydrolase [Alphaproteobacteria bacterium]